MESKPKRRGRPPKTKQPSPPSDPATVFQNVSVGIAQVAKKKLDADLRGAGMISDAHLKTGNAVSGNGWFNRLSLAACPSELLILGEEIAESPFAPAVAGTGDIGDESSKKPRASIRSIRGGAMSGKRRFSEMRSSETQSGMSMMDGSSLIGDVEEDDEECGGDSELDEDLVVPSMDGMDLSLSGPMAATGTHKAKRRTKALPKEFTESFKGDSDMQDVIGDGSILDDEHSDTSQLLDPLRQAGVDETEDVDIATLTGNGVARIVPTADLRFGKRGDNLDLDLDKSESDRMAEALLQSGGTLDEVRHYLNCEMAEQLLAASTVSQYGDEWHVSKHGLQLLELALFTELKNVLSKACETKSHCDYDAYGTIFAEQWTDNTLAEWIRKENEAFDKLEAKESEESAADTLATEKADLRFKSLTGTLTADESQRKSELTDQIKAAKTDYSLAALGGDFSFDFSAKRKKKKTVTETPVETARKRRIDRMHVVSENDLLSAICADKRLSKVFPTAHIRMP